MVNRIQTLRSSVAGNLPASGTRQPGELWVNFADKQIGYIDASQVAQKTQAVRFFSNLSTYAVGDFVWNAGALYAANVAVTPGTFNPAQWNLIGGANATFLPLAGGTLTGGLTLSAGSITVSAGNITASGIGTFNDVKTATLEATGALTALSLATTGGGITAQTTITANGTITAQAPNGYFLAKGPFACLQVSDRGNSGGNTANVFSMYRDGNISRLATTEASDVLEVTSNGWTTIMHGLTVNGPTYPVNISVAAGNGPAITFQQPGYDQWLLGPLANTSAFYLYDMTAAASIATFTSTVSTFYGYTTQGNGAGQWTSSATVTFSTNNAAGPIVATATALAAYSTYNGGSCLWAAAGTINAALLYFTYGASTAQGSITMNGSGVFYNTVSDARLKDNIRPLVSEIDVGDLIDRLEPVAFEWKPETIRRPRVVGKARKVDDRVTVPPDPTEVEFEESIRETFTDYGFVAQDLYKVVPHIVTPPPETPVEGGPDVWMADVSKLVPYLVAELQSLRKRVSQLEAA